MICLVGILVTVIGMSTIPVNADDVDKLIRIKPDDWWVYQKIGPVTSTDQYNVTTMDIINDKELNLVDTNSSTIDYFTTSWEDGSYSFDTQTQTFQLYNDARGNFIGLIEGTDTLNVGTPQGTIIILRDGTLWERTSTESVNQAIVTGEPRTVVYEYHKNRVWYEDVYERKEIIDIILSFIAYPSDEHTTTFNKTLTTAINITFSLSKVQLTCDFNNGTVDIWVDQTFTYSYLQYPVHIVYTYANEIGLPIGIDTLNTIAVAGSGAELMSVSTEIEQSIKLINYDVEESNITSDTTETSNTSGSGLTTSNNTPLPIVELFIAVLVLGWGKRWKSHE